jgi:hypothetical protein
MATVINGTATIPAISSVNEIIPDQDFIAPAIRTLPGVANPTVKILASSGPADKLATDANTALLGAGYAFVFPGADTPTKQGLTIYGLYSKVGQPDVLVVATDIPATPTLFIRTGFPALSATNVQQLYSQLKGYTSVALLLVGSGIVQGLKDSAGANITSASSTPTGSSTSVSGTVASTPALPAVGEKDIPLYPGSKKVNTGSAVVGDTTSLYYVSSADYSQIVAWASPAFSSSGWDGVNTTEQSGATVLTGRKGKYNLILTIIGPSARTNSAFDVFIKQANAGPQDTVLVAVITS